MPLFSGEIEGISKTKIFVAKVYPKSKKANERPLQLTVISNMVLTKDFGQLAETDIPGLRKPPAYMLIPFPLLRGSNRFKILDFTKYKHFFEDIELIFPNRKAASFHDFLQPDSEDMENQRVEDYRVSRAFSLKELESAFPAIRPEVKETLRTYYPTGYGFIICELTAHFTFVRYTPLAYIHELREDGKFFLPTRFYRKKILANPYSRFYAPSESKQETDEIDELNNFVYNTLMVDDDWLRMNSKRKDLKSYNEVPDLIWDHEIYVANPFHLKENPLLKQPGTQIAEGDVDRLPRFYNYVEKSLLPGEIILPNPSKLYQVRIDGKYKWNHDFYL